MADTVSQAGVGTAHLSSELDDDGPYTIHGVALGAGDVTVGQSGIKKKWPADELKKAAETLAGQPLVKDHENNTDGTVGEVTKASYREGVGVIYEAEIAPHYEQLAKDISAGILDVSARAYHAPVDDLDEDPDTGALKTEDVLFDNLAVVSSGASPSNTVQMGEATALAEGPGGQSVAVMQQGSERMSAAELQQTFDELATHEFDEGDWVKGDSSGGTWHGKVRGMKMDGCYSDEIDGDQEICASDDEPVYLIENYDPESGEFTDTMVAHLESSISEWDHEEASDHEHEMTPEQLEDEVDEVYSEWSDHVNMTASELEEWSNHPCAEEASVDTDAVIDRNMHLLETNKSDWGADEVEDAKRTISFISRMSDEANEPDDPRDGPHGCPSEWAISLLNWAHNPFDSIPEVPDEMKEENRTHPDMTEMPRSDHGNAPEWEEGNMVRWQVEPDLFGKIVHVDEEKHVAMVEIMGMEDGDLTSTGFTITAGFSDIKPMTMPESKSDMAKHGDEDDEMSMSFLHDAVSELAEVNGLDINGLVMWDDKMGVISDFVREDGTLMVEIDVMERDDGSFRKTGDTVTAPLEETESMGDGIDAKDDRVAEELEAAWHTPEWDGLDEEREWEKPAMEDFDTDDMSEIDDHFIVSKTGEWPPENYGDLALPVVFPDGDLSLDALDSAHQTAPQMDGVSDDMADKLQTKIDNWAQEHFDQPVAGEQMEEGDDRSVTVAMLGDDDARSETTGQSTADIAALKFGTPNDTTMSDIEYESASDDAIDEMNDPVVVERDDVEELSTKAARADELDDRLDDVNQTLDELSENQDVLDDVDQDRLEELSEYDDPHILSDEEHEELRGLVEDVGGMFAEELADYSPFTAEELSARFDPTELRDKVESHDEASVGAELGAGEPDPDGGSASKEELSDPDPDETDEVDEEELRNAVASNLEDDGLTRQAEKVRSGEISLEEMGIDPDEMGVEA